MRCSICGTLKGGLFELEVPFLLFPVPAEFVSVYMLYKRKKKVISVIKITYRISYRILGYALDDTL
jgi:hypothetical protein